MPQTIGIRSNISTSKPTHKLLKEMLVGKDSRGHDVMQVSLFAWPALSVYDLPAQELDKLFDIVKSQVKHLVVLLTADTLKRPWCSGEIVTALRMRLSITRLHSSSFVGLSEESNGSQRTACAHASGGITGSFYALSRPHLCLCAPPQLRAWSAPSLFSENMQVKLHAIRNQRICDHTSQPKASFNATMPLLVFVEQNYSQRHWWSRIGAPLQSPGLPHEGPESSWQPARSLTMGHGSPQGLGHDNVAEMEPLTRH